ncbi:diaminopimelate decarboxylase [Actinocorallia herbida]|uniref:Diaminopimelate decarboxylase n=1 Tax=Actinocorallia herbida TaxID=58109 RepID=A0A3N1D082_9ACTN|nr:diaminopimelate decarboxylase [Actinocorallia herbida]ROO86929.1 diaminopimelate decarboxylase [Actinocorallia herbida]
MQATTAVPHPATDPSRRDRVLRAAVRAGLIGPDHPTAGFLDVDGLLTTVADLKAAFGDAPVLHAFAAKSTPLVPVLRLLAEAGLGCEVASPGELALAVAAGFAPDRIVLDSPVKTRAELARALALGVAINADNLAELARVDALLTAVPSASVLGLRLNPQVGAGTIAAMSTASRTSKFGVPMTDPGARQAVIDAFDAYPWLTRLHVHVGSQGCPPELITAGVGAAYDLAEEINARAGTRRVTGLDIGGGLPVDFDGDTMSPSHADYVSWLREAVPGLFDGRYELVTEFGRSVTAKNGFTAAVVEYVKDVGGRRIALTHAGAHLATRTVFMPDSWPLRVAAYTAEGLPKGTAELPHDVAGPCCFAGDVVARDRPLPELAPGDLITLLDTGGYAFTAHWSYNNVTRPAVHGFTTAGGEVRFTTIRAEQTTAEILAESGADLADDLLALEAAPWR